MPAVDWRERVACTPAQADLFDELEMADRGRGGNVGIERISQASAICDGCPVRLDCLEDAIASRDSGVRGGLYLEAGEIVHIVTDRTDRRTSIRGQAVAS